uniref:BTB domain-containing protein n=1 Tax=Panthera tigris altaica TaxID=74533 RepID=A0A8C9KBM1_PANTA
MGIDEFTAISFPNHSSEVLCSLNEQRQDGLLCDVLLVVQEHEYRTHRAVLAACSKYFKKLFTAGALASQPYVYEIDFVQPEALAAILDFAYTSTLTITASNVKHILNAARMLEIQCIVNVCLEIMEPGGDGGEEDDKEDDDDDEDDDDEEDEEEEEEEEEEDEDDDTEDFADQENLPDPQDINCHQSPSKTDHLTEKAYSDAPRDFPDSFQAGSPGHLGVIRDFSIESLLRENLYPKANITDRRPSLSPFAPDFFPHLWPGDFGAFAQLPEQPMDSGPLDLVIKNRKIKEEEKEELPQPPPPPFPKAHRGGLFPPWPLVEERKLKPKASQQCPICHKVIMGAGKLMPHSEPAQDPKSLPSRPFPHTAFCPGHAGLWALPSLGRGLNLLSHCRQTSRPPDTRTFSELASWFGQDIGLYRRAAFQNPPSQHIPDDHLGGLCACSLTSPPGQTGRPRGGLASALPSLRFAPALLCHTNN